MSGTLVERDMSVRSGDVSLAGTLWLPTRPASATVLMHPGSGGSDRHNDVFFPPIREHLLSRDIAVCSFDKRGVGGSTGRWQEAAIEAQAEDALAAFGALLSDDVDGPVGLFGHSQGGWVVVEAASRSSDVAFVITSSGPGVTPGEQERYATVTRLAREAATQDERDEVLRTFDSLIGMMRAGLDLEEVRAALDPAALEAAEDLGLPDDVDWNLMQAIVDYDPRPALERIDAPVLALFGEDDHIVPVEESVRVFQEAVKPGLLDVEVFPGADHRIQVGDPPRLADGYLDAIATFVVTTAARSRM